jgi:hypothetical protein
MVAALGLISPGLISPGLIGAGLISVGGGGMVAVWI